MSRVYFRSYYEKMLADVARGMGMDPDTYRRWVLRSQAKNEIDRIVAHMAMTMVEEPRLVLANGEPPYALPDTEMHRGIPEARRY